MDSTFFQSIANLGFPIAITLFLLIRMESKIETLSNSINQLTMTIEKMEFKDKYLDDKKESQEYSFLACVYFENIFLVTNISFNFFQIQIIIILNIAVNFYIYICFSAK